MTILVNLDGQFLSKMKILNQKKDSLETIFKISKRKPILIETDRAKNFHNSFFSKFLKQQ